jgi:hypothetical protein
VHDGSDAAAARWSSPAITYGIHYRFYPKLVKQAMKAAEKIEASGLPRRAYDEVPDRLVRAILEGGAMEDDEVLHEMWANLLANVIVTSGVHQAFPAILRDIGPMEALLLEYVFQNAHAHGEMRMADGRGSWTDVEVGTARLGKDRRLDATERSLASLNLVRLGLFGPPGAKERFVLTELGDAFYRACQPPRPLGAEPSM